MKLRVSLVAGLMFLCLPAIGQVPLPEKAAVVYGQDIRYIEAGQGPTVILLHGLGATKETWLPSVGALSAKYHVYAIDQLGFGHSAKPTAEYKIGTWVDFLQGFLAAQKLEKATLVGNSLGGWIALDFTLQHPEMVDKLVLVDSAGLTWRQGGKMIDLNPATIAATRTLLESLFYDKKMVTDQFVMQAFTNHMRNSDGYTIQRTMAGLAQASFDDDKLKTMRTPTLVVWGREDELLAVESAERFHVGIPGARLVVFDHCGHVPQIEKPEEFNRAVLDFLAK